MRVLYFGSYNPDYARNRVLIKGLRENGVEVLECQASGSSFKAFFKLFFKYFKFIGKYDFMLVGFPGQEAMFLAKFLTRKSIIFDAFTSHYGGYILDRQKYSKTSIRAGYYRFLDRWSCKLADTVLLDTKAHIDFFTREFGLPKKKFLRFFVGADSDVFYPRNFQKSLANNFLVHFHGHYIPLQGVQYIVRAAKFLEKENISFNLIGQGQTFEKDRQLALKLQVNNVNFIDEVPYQKLCDYMAQADICLGIFGDSPKTDLVIPNKIYEALAMAKPVITADTPGIRELLADEIDVFLCRKANAESLAEKILSVKNRPEAAEKVAQNGHRIFKEKLKEKILTAELLKNVNEKFTLRK